MIAFRSALVAAGFALSVLPSLAASQTIVIEPLDDLGTGFLTDSLESEIFLRNRSIYEEFTEEVRAIPAQGAVLRGLDKMNGQVADVTLENGYSVLFGELRIDLAECRYPEDNATGEAYAFLTIQPQTGGAPVFQGWMIASSPALNAMDHARYDVWVLRCAQAESTSESEGN